MTFAADHRERRRRGRDLALFGAALGIAFALVLTHLGSESLLGDEALYASVASDSLRAEQWFPLRYSDQTYSGKPPLWIWTIAGSFAALGANELSARLPSALAGLAALGLFLFLASRRFGAPVAAFATLLLATGHHLLFRHGLRQAVMEPPLLLATIGLTFALTDSGRALRARCLSAAAWGIFGAAVKGLAMPAFALAFGLPYALIVRRRRSTGFLTSLAMAILAGLATWGFWLASLLAFDVAGVGALASRDVVERLRAGIDPEHLQGVFYFFEVAWRELGPLSVLGLLAFLRRPLQAPEPGAGGSSIPDWAMPLCAAFGPLVLYSFSASKLSWYIYPALPGLALLVALGVAWLAAAAGRVHWLLGAVVAIALALPLISRAEGRWRRINSVRPESVTLRLLAEEMRSNPRARILFDAPTDLALGPVREWHWFYLNKPPDPLLPSEAPLDSGRCPLLVTWRPAHFRERPEFAATAPLPVHRVTATEVPLFILDGCGGEIAAKLSTGAGEAASRPAAEVPNGSTTRE